MAKKNKPTPIYAHGRRGGRSIVDSIVHELLRTKDGWPIRSFGELRDLLSPALGYELSTSTIRSSIYSRSDVFEKVVSEAGIGWRLSEKTRREQG